MTDRLLNKAAGYSDFNFISFFSMTFACVVADPVFPQSGMTEFGCRPGFAKDQTFDIRSFIGRAESEGRGGQFPFAA